MKILYLLTLFPLVFSINQCPVDMVSSGWTKDMALASDMVSGDSYSFQGTCGIYQTLKTCDMNNPYYTRMRIYQLLNTNIIVFRPTQPNSQIHTNRYMTKCTFLDSIQECGSVHNHFQEAFIYMFEECKDIIESIKENRILIAGHSLGGSLSLFLAAKLYYDYNITPTLCFGFAGPFIGDITYTQTVQNPLKYLLNIKQVEVVDINNPNNKDGTAEGYNTDDNGIFIDYDLICAFLINPLPVDPSKSYDPHYTYGMHDIKNYLLPLNGSYCNV